MTTFSAPARAGRLPAAGSDEASIATLADCVLARCDALATCTCSAGTICRSFLSPAMARCNAMVAGWMQAAGMHVQQDTAGNLRGLYPAFQTDAPTLILGSHLDTVPAAGKYDGVLGVMLGLALVDSLQGRRLPFSIEVIGFSDEEGVRFGLPFIGSRAMVQTLHADDLQRLDAGDVSLGAALQAFATDHADATPARLPSNARAYLEFHIEQGPVLCHAEQGLAAVHAISGQSRATLTFHGQAGHAGTTPMHLRLDAMMAAAEWMLHVETTANTTPGIVATTGRVQCTPGAVNVVPGRALCSLDLRTPDDALRHSVLQRLLDAANAIGVKRGIGMSYTSDMDQATVPLDDALTTLAQRCVTAMGGRPETMVSGAGHDAMVLAPHLPATVIFLRSPAGISHHPSESVRPEDVAAALRAGVQFLAEFPKWLEENEASL